MHTLLLTRVCTEARVHTQAHTPTQMCSYTPSCQMHTCRHECTLLIQTLPCTRLSQMRVLTHNMKVRTLTYAHIHVLPWDGISLSPSSPTHSHTCSSTRPFHPQPSPSPTSSHLWPRKCKSLLPGHPNQFRSPQPLCRWQPESRPTAYLSRELLLTGPSGAHFPSSLYQHTGPAPPPTHTYPAPRSCNKDPQTKVPSLGCRTHKGGLRVLCSPWNPQSPRGFSCLQPSTGPGLGIVPPVAPASHSCTRAPGYDCREAGGNFVQQKAEGTLGGNTNHSKPD